MTITLKRFVSIVLALSILIGAAPALAAAQSPGAGRDIVHVDAAHTVTELKYFVLAETPDFFPLSHGELGLGTFGTELFPVIPDGRGFYFEWVQEQSQDIRLELWSAAPGATPDAPQAGAYLGLIAEGYAEGQWGDYVNRETGLRPGDQWFREPDQGEERPVANRFYWDGLYWDDAHQAFMQPGQTSPGELVAKQEFLFIVRFQPTHPDAAQWYSDLPIRVDYSEDAVVRNSQLRALILALYEHRLIPYYGGDPIFMPTGNFLWEYTDFAVHGAQPLEFMRYYNAQDGDTGELGVGWRHSFMIGVESGPLFATVTLAEGVSVSFARNRDGTFSASEGVPLTLERHGGGYLFTTLDRTRHYFDQEGRLTAITDVRGETTAVARDGDSITSVSNRSGTLAFQYSGGRIVGITDHTGRNVRYEYDDSGNLASFTNADGNIIRYTYQGHWMTEIWDFNGSLFLRNAYDSLGRVVEQYVAGQGISLFSYDFDARTSTWTQPNGAVRRYHYDEGLRITAFEDAAGVVRYEYSSGRLTAISDRLGGTTRFSYDPAGNRTGISHPDGTSESFSHNAMGLVTRHVARDGSVTRFEYDSRGNMTAAIGPRGNALHFEYDERNNMVSSTDALGGTTRFTHDHGGNVLTETDPLGNVTRFEYDSLGRLVLQTNPDGSTAAFSYSPAGKLIGIADAAGNAQAFTVDGNGLTIGITDAMGFSSTSVNNGQNQPVSMTDAEGNTTTLAYDAEGRLISVTDALGGTVSYAYDHVGRMTSMTDALGNRWEFSFDAEGRLTGTADPMGNRTASTFDSMGRLTSSTDARGATTTFGYDAMGRLARVTDAHGSSATADFDASGNITARRDRNGNRWEYEYDLSNRLVGVTDPLGNTTALAYDDNGRLIRATSALGSQRINEFDEMGRLTRSVDAEGNATEYSYDILGRLVRIGFPDGTYALNEYNANGWLVRAVAPDGGATQYEYDRVGRVTAVTDALGGVTRFGRDALGRVTSVTDPLGGVTTFAFDAGGNMISTVDAMGAVTRYAYDSLNQLISITDALGGVTRMEYDPSGNVARITNPDGGIIAYAHDPLGRLATITDPEGNVFSFGYDANDNRTSFTDARGNTSYATFDALNRTVGMTDAAGGISTVEFDADGRVVTATNADGAVTRYEHDRNGNIVRATDALGNSTIFTYDSMGKVATITDARGAVTGFSYNAAGQVEKITDALGGVRRFEYDLLGRLVRETDELGRATLYTHDALSRVLTVTNPLGHSNTFVYDSMGRIVSATDRNGNSTSFLHDPNGNIVEVIDALGHGSRFEYDSMNRLEAMTLLRTNTRQNVSESQTTLYQYDLRGLVTRVVNAAGHGTLYVHDPNGNMVQKTDADGHVTQFAYDPRNLVEAINYSDGRRATFTYNASGELVAMTDWNGTVGFALDLLGRIESVNDHNSRTVSYEYDAVGNRTGVVYPDGTAARYEFDLLGRMTALNDAEGQRTSFQYDAASQPIAQSLPNGWRVAYAYDAAGQLLSQVSTDPTNTPSKTSTHRFTYDPQGNVATEFRSGTSGQERFNLAHSYDALGRLTATTGDQGFRARSYEYDSLGNLVFERNHNRTTEYWHNSLNQITRRVHDGRDEHTFRYDNRGNLVEGVFHRNRNHAIIMETYAYDSANRMARGTNEDREESRYIFNGLGHLVAREMTIRNNNYGYTGTSVRKDYVLDYTDPLARPLMEHERGGSSPLALRYVYALQLSHVVIHGVPGGVGAVAQTFDYPGGPERVVKLHHHHDRLGSVDLLTNNVNGDVASYVTYDQWGLPLMTALLRLSVRQLNLTTSYTGHMWDPVLGAYYARARMYDAASRRFMAVDLVKGWAVRPATLIQYTYVANNPLKYTDPTGLSPHLAFMNGAGVAVTVPNGSTPQSNHQASNPARVPVPFHHDDLPNFYTNGGEPVRPAQTPTPRTLPPAPRLPESSGYFPVLECSPWGSLAVVNYWIREQVITSVERLCARGLTNIAGIFIQESTVLVIDLRTGIMFDMFVGEYSGNNIEVTGPPVTRHLDVAPLTPADTDLFWRTRNHVASWTGHPVWIITHTSDGEVDRVIAGALRGLPHYPNFDIDNNFNGHVCIHFHGTVTNNSPCYPGLRRIAEEALAVAREFGVVSDTVNRGCCNVCRDWSP